MPRREPVKLPFTGHPIEEMTDEVPLDVGIELSKLEHALDPELVKRITLRYERLFERTLRDRRTRALEVMDTIAAECGFVDAVQFKHAIDLHLSREYAVLTGAAEPDELPQSAQMNRRIYSILTKWEGACSALHIMHRGGTAELLQRSLEIEETVWRAEKAGEIDKLTGLVSDQDAITKRFEIEREHYLENGKDDEIMLWVEIDLDNFKTLNTRFGHTVVDAQILKPLAKRLQAVIRSTDSACRFGGDEFSLLLNCVRAGSVDLIMNKILEVIREPFILSTEASVSISASMGALQIDKHRATTVNTASTDQFMGDVRKQADIAAEFSKNQGKNRWTHYSVELKDFAESEVVYVARFVRNHLHDLQRFRDLGLYEQADEFQSQLEQIARNMYAAEQT